MANVLNKLTGQILRSVNEPEYPETDWVWSPDLSAFSVVGGYKSKYAVLPATNPVQIMSQAERDAVDAAEEASRRANIKAQLKDRFDDVQNSDKAIVLMMIDEINLLRAALDEIKAQIKPAALNNALTYNTGSERTPSQARTAYLNKVDSL